MAFPQVIIIGGGAAGFFGAIAAAETNPNLRVILLEAGPEVLTKVRISGGGRCNVTHACFDPAALVQHYPRGSRALISPFSRFQPGDTIAWFEDRGVSLKTEADGRLFPVTDDSATIVHCLQKAAQQAGVEIRTRCPVIQVRNLPVQNLPGRELSEFELTLKNGLALRCDRLLLASGSSPLGHRIATHLGHTIAPIAPSLFTFNIADSALKTLAGVSVPNAQLKLLANGIKFNQSGPLLITHWGLSGPAVLKLSAWAARELKHCNYRAQLWVNWLPELSGEQVRDRLTAGRSQAPRKQLSNHRPLPLPQRLWDYLLAHTAIDPATRWSELSKSALHRLSQAIHQGEYAITGKGVFKDEFVTCGGINLNEVNFKTLESRIAPGLYFAGEVLDIDGVTGGFNFQNAWTTSYLAGQSMAKGLLNA
ncbi:MAG: NAD(P)/FAD-dependent oxidoreductase [Synechococcales cyanobacterium CRU_2_2]|nr:NAD(P)/FAD-dependent oxidoreductase [Synechococcales cyanobacterium CRU_2_2]